MEFLDNCHNCVRLRSNTDDPHEKRILPFGKWYPGPQNPLSQCNKNKDEEEDDGPTILRQDFVRGDFL